MAADGLESTKRSLLSNKLIEFNLPYGNYTLTHRGHSHRIVFSNGNYEDFSVTELTQLKELEGEV